MPDTAAYAGLEATLEEKRLRVEEGSGDWPLAGRAAAVEAALEDSLYAPAKRLRPIVSLMVAEVLRGDTAAVLPAGCALEMVHTASLILDDLPSMDDARTRRGRPACHVAHGEATAILAAFALLNRAFEILAEGWPGGPDAAVRTALARDLARAVGLDGMIAGQAADLAATNRRGGLRDPGVHPQPEDGCALHGVRVGRRGGRARAPRGGGRPHGLRQEPGPRLPDRGRPHRRDRAARRGGKGRGPGPEEDHVRVVLRGRTARGSSRRS